MLYFLHLTKYSGIVLLHRLSLDVFLSSLLLYHHHHHHHHHHHFHHRRRRRHRRYDHNDHLRRHRLSHSHRRRHRHGVVDGDSAGAADDDNDDGDHKDDNELDTRFLLLRLSITETADISLYFLNNQHV